MRMLKRMQRPEPHCLAEPMAARCVKLDADVTSSSSIALTDGVHSRLDCGSLCDTLPSYVKAVCHCDVITFVRRNSWRGRNRQWCSIARRALL